MIGRRLFLPDIRGVAIRAVTRLLELRQLVFDRSDLRVRNLLVVLVARRARGYRNVGRQSAERTRPRDVDVTGRALLHMIFFSAFVSEVCRNTFWGKLRHESSCRLMAPGTVVTGRLQILPMTGEASVMRMRHGLERVER